MAGINELAKKALRKFAEGEPNQAAHPIHKVVEMINQTPIDMIEHDYKQGQDGSVTITFKIPSRAEQAKQKAMEQAMQQQATQPGQMLQAKPEVNDMMGNGAPASSNVSKMPSGGSAGMQPEQPAAAAAVSNIQIKVAMSPEKAAKELKTQYPTGFLKSMGL